MTAAESVFAADTAAALIQITCAASGSVFPSGTHRREPDRHHRSVHREHS
jgi:hypothetical protein